MADGELIRKVPVNTPGREIARQMLNRHHTAACLGLHRVDTSALQEHIAFRRETDPDIGQVRFFDSLHVDMTVILYLDAFDDPLDAAIEFGPSLAELLKEHDETVPNDFCVAYIFQKLVDDFING